MKCRKQFFYAKLWPRLWYKYRNGGGGALMGKTRGGGGGGRVQTEKTRKK